jgi:histone acetyltransferase (RNA polymerase elongator complex component)
MKLKTPRFTIPVFFPQLACPFQCVFCNQEKITSRGHIPDEEEVISIIEQYHFSFPKGNKHVEIGFFGGTFTGMPLVEQERYLRIAFSYKEKGFIQGIRLSTRPDYIDENVLALLKNYGVTTIELGAQSMDEEVLACSARGHTAEDTAKASSMIIAHGFRLGLQMMVGLPGDNLESDLFTARRIVELGACETRIYPVLVIRGTKLEEWHQKGEYQPLSLEETVIRLKSIIPVFEEAKVEVTRVGLLTNRGFLENELVAGPYHPSIRELAMTEVWWDRLKGIGHRAEGIGLRAEGKEIMITVHPSQYNFVIGYYGKNRKRLLHFYRDVIFQKNPNLKINELQFEILSR